MSDPVFKVSYFPFYGRAEASRLLLTHKGIPFEDNVIEMQDWPAIKPTVEGNCLPQWQNLKEGWTKGGSARAVMRFLAMKYGYYPMDPNTAQMCDMLVDGYYDVFAAGTDAFFGKGNDPSTVPDCQKKYCEEVLPKFLAILEPLCAKGQFICGSKICLADFWIGGMICGQFRNPECFGCQNGAFAKLEQQFPEFSKYCDRFVKENQKRMDTRPTRPI